MKLSGSLLLALLLLVAPPLAAQPTAGSGAAEQRWRAQAGRVTIIRDTWGIPHVYGRSDADAVFGVVYAQAEDDFNRIETNFLNSMGRLAEAEGEAEIFRDLRMKLFIDPADMKAKYAASPGWLKSLMNAWADGLNFYLLTHPHVKPRVLTEFEPWMALTFSEGSIGGDIERVNLGELERFYGNSSGAAKARRQTGVTIADADGRTDYQEPTGSNGIAIGPGASANRRALLLINPHTSFFFRAEAQMVSQEGLNAYGALTWGQFFVYQGFNERAGWMHTSSGVDNIDEYAESVTKGDRGYVYRYGTETRPVRSRRIVVPYKTASGSSTREFTAHYTHHGPVVRETDGKWISVRLMQDPVKALSQSYLRTKATNYKQFRKTLDLHTNSSNNTIYADADGTIAYFHSNFIPRRDARFDWTKPVDGSDKATEWKGVHSIDDSPLVVNPAAGWLYNSNDWPWSAAGEDSPRRDRFPAYVDRGIEESPRGEHALRLLRGVKDVTVDSLITLAYDSYLPLFEKHLPRLVAAWDALPDSDAVKARLTGPIAALRGWDYRWSTESIPTSLAVYWGEDAGRRVADAARAAGMSTDTYIATAAPGGALLAALTAAVDRLTADFGTWQTPWGVINRFQRISGDIAPKFDDGKPSLPVGFTSARWGSLASFGARTFGTKKMYGTTGNSFVAAVEFGPTVRARAITAGGQSGDLSSPHFADQAQRYSTGDLRDVYFYREDLAGHIESEYRPGEKAK